MSKNRRKTKPSSGNEQIRRQELLAANVSKDDGALTLNNRPKIQESILKDTYNLQSFEYTSFRS